MDTGIDGGAAVLEKLRERKEYFLQILGLTEGIIIRDDEIDEYADMISKRQVLFEKIYGIDDFLKSAGSLKLLHSAPPGVKAEIEEINNCVKAAALKIYEFDKNNESVINEMYKKLRGTFKTVNDGKAIRSIYLNQEFHGGYYFDKKQ